MNESTPEPSGAFARVLTDEDGIRRFNHEVLEPIKREEAGLEPAWRLGFRATLPFFRLLDQRQQQHLRGIFKHRLPDLDIPVDKFERDEKVELDVLAEMYVGQAGVFLDLMLEHDYEVARQTRRDASGRIIALSLSGSIFFLDSSDQGHERSYRYDNIYGNRRVEPTGRCRLKGHPRVGHRLRSDRFLSSPLLLLAVHPADVVDDEDLARLSDLVGDELSSRVEEISRVSRVRLYSAEEAPSSEDDSQ